MAAPAVVALDVPPPPARVISTPPEPVAPVESTTVERPAPATRPPRRRGRRRPGRKRPSRPSPVAAEPAADAPASAAPEPRASAGAAAADAADGRREQCGAPDEATSSAARRSLLDRVNPATLGQQARQQHETARRFVEQAQQALVERNYVLASYLADKAETLAKGLSR